MSTGFFQVTTSCNFHTSGCGFHQLFSPTCKKDKVIKTVNPSKHRGEVISPQTTMRIDTSHAGTSEHQDPQLPLSQNHPQDRSRSLTYISAN